MIVTWKRVRLGNQLFSIEIQNGRFSKIVPDDSGPDNAKLDNGVEYNGEGLLYLPAFSDMHCHLDKHFIGEKVWHSRQTIDTLPNQLKREQDLMKILSLSVQERARVMLGVMLNHGTTKIRTHVDIDPQIGLKHLEAVLEIREEYRDVIDIEIVAFPQQGFIRSNALHLMREAMRLGADFVGAVDPGGLDQAIEPCLDEVFGLASEFNAGVDIHLHDSGHLGVYTIERMADFTEQAGLHHKVAVSHAWGLGHITQQELIQLGNKMSEQGVAIVSSVPIDRPMPDLPLLNSLGVKTMIGTDNVLDAWSPYGSGDMLQRTSRLAERWGWVQDDQLLRAYQFSINGSMEPVVGERADFILVDDVLNVEHAVSAVPNREWVIAGGRPAGGKRYKE